MTCNELFVIEKSIMSLVLFEFAFVVIDAYQDWLFGLKEKLWWFSCGKVETMVWSYNCATCNWWYTHLYLETQRWICQRLLLSQNKWLKQLWIATKCSVRYLWVFQVMSMILEFCASLVCIGKHNTMGFLILKEVHNMSFLHTFWVTKSTLWFIG